MRRQRERDRDEEARSWRKETATRAWLPSRWSVWLPGLRRMDLPGYGDAVSWSCGGVVASGLRVVDGVL